MAMLRKPETPPCLCSCGERPTYDHVQFIVGHDNAYLRQLRRAVLADRLTREEAIEMADEVSAAFTKKVLKSIDQWRGILRDSRKEGGYDRCPKGHAKTNTNKRGANCKLCDLLASQAQYKDPDGRAMMQAAGARSRAKLRAEMIEAYGDWCRGCGNSGTEDNGLETYHEGGGGETHRQSMDSGERVIYRALRAAGWPDELDGYPIVVLCRKCRIAASTHDGLVRRYTKRPV